MKFSFLFLFLCKLNSFLLDKNCKDESQQIKWKIKDNINNQLALKVNVIQVKSKNAFEQLKQIDNKKFQEMKESLLLNKDSLSIWEIDLFENMDNLITTIDNRNFYYGTIIFLNFNDNENKNKIIFPDSTNVIEITIENNDFTVNDETEYQNDTIYLEEK